jgi:hypothetical protein
VTANLDLVWFIALHCNTTAQEKVWSVQATALNNLEFMPGNIRSLREPIELLHMIELPENVGILKRVTIPATKD